MKHGMHTKAGRRIQLLASNTSHVLWTGSERLSWRNLYLQNSRNAQGYGRLSDEHPESAIIVHRLS